VTWHQRATLAALVVLVVGALGFQLQIGFLALAAGGVLALFDRENLGKAVDGISWPTILLVAGMVTYVGVLEHSGTIDWVAHGAVGLGAPLLVALVLCVIVGVTSAFASSTAILTATIPMAIPLLLTDSLPIAGVVAAMAISTTIVDVSPFSTNGALVLANARGVDRNRFYRQVISYTCVIVALGPVAAWAVLVLPGSF
jgi:di/tricarboxylate transporter